MFRAPLYFLPFADQTSCNSSNGLFFAERHRANVKIDAARKIKTSFDRSFDLCL